MFNLLRNIRIRMNAEFQIISSIPVKENKCKNSDNSIFDDSSDDEFG